MDPHAAKYRNEESARQYLEKTLWPEGPACPHCGGNEPVYMLESKAGSEHRLRPGVYKCGGCRKRFTVTAGTIFRGSHIALHKWLLACELMCSTKRGVSALSLQQELQLGSYRSAWFMCRRIRWALDTIPEHLRKLDAMQSLLEVTPAAGMPRPGTRRQKSVWVQVDEELHGKEKKGRAPRAGALPEKSNRF